MGKASRRRRDARSGAERTSKAKSKLYREIPAPVIAACEEVLRAYTSGGPPTGDPSLLDGWQANIYAEAAALEALDILTDRRGTSSDLLFADLLAESVFAPLTPAMLPLLQFLRARRAGQFPTLHLAHDTPHLALTLLVLAGHALVEAVDRSPGDPAAEAALQECLGRLADRPLDERVPAGDLGFALTDQQRTTVGDEAFYRDEQRKILTGAVPLRRALATPGLPVLLVLDLTARPDVQDLLRLLQSEAPADGADTVTRWRALAGMDSTLIRLEVDWLEPVRTKLAVVLDADDYRHVLDAIVAQGHLDLTETDPADSLDTAFPLARISLTGTNLADLLRDCAARRA